MAFVGIRLLIALVTLISTKCRKGIKIKNLNHISKFLLLSIFLVIIWLIIVLIVYFKYISESYLIFSWLSIYLNIDEKYIFL